MRILAVIGILALILVIGGIVTKSVKRAEQLECQQWFVQSENLPNWFSLNWQKSQCQKYGFDI